MKKLIVATLLVLFSSSLFAQCPFKYGANEDDSLKCLEQMTNFNMFYKAKNYKDAYEAWRYITNQCPCAWDGIYTNAQTMFQNLIKVETDSLQKEQYIDTLIYSYEVRNNYFPEKFSKGYCLGFKAYNQLQYRGKKMSTKEEYEAILEMFSQSVEMEKEKTQPAIWDKYFVISEALTKATKDTTYVIEAYGRATDYLDLSINNAIIKFENDTILLDSLTQLYNAGQLDRISYDKQTKSLISDTTRQRKLEDNYRKTLAKIEKSVTPYASCEVLEEVYSKKIESCRDDISAINKMVKTMSKGGCLTNPTFKEALQILHQANPNRTSAFWMGNLSLKSYVTTHADDELEAAINYLKEAVQLSETGEQKADANYMLAVAFQTKKSYSEARSAALAAIKTKPNMGKAYLLIGDLYASGCNDDVPLSYAWAAADKYAKAAAVDPSCAESAQAKRAKLRFPSKDELFKRGLNQGSSYHVGGWIQETTTVR